MDERSDLGRVLDVPSKKDDGRRPHALQERPERGFQLRPLEADPEELPDLFLEGKNADRHRVVL